MNGPTFAGKFDHDGFFAWLNPDLPHEQVYDRTRLLAEFAEIPEETYDYFLGVLPPIHFTGSSFAICEATTADIRLGLFRVKNRYFAAHVSDFDPAHKMDATRKAIEESAP